MKNDSDAFSPEYLRTHAHETPCFIFSKKKILENIAEFKSCFPNALIHYAMKANSEPEILKLFAEEDIGFEVASEYELQWLKDIDVSPYNILYGTSIKPARHIKNFFDYGVEYFVVDSFQEVEKIAANAPGSKVFVRITVNDTGSVFRFSEKFGTTKENILPLFERVREVGLVPYGISFHVGSQASNKRAWALALTEIIPAIEELSLAGITLQAINLGGGFPCNTYASSEETFTLQDIADTTLEAYEKLPYQPELILEPGRALVANAGIAIASVIAKVERKEHTWLFLDAGVYNAFFEAMAYQGSTRYKITSLKGAGDSGEKLFAVAGPTGDSPDIITREALLPSDVDVGDKLVIHDVGAYSLVCTSIFNGFPKPKVYFV